MSCPVNFSTVKKGIENKAAEMLTQSGQFERVDQTSVRVTATTSDYNNLISNVNDAFKEEIIKKHGELEYKIQPSDNLINTYLEAAPVGETTAPIKPGVAELFESNPELANEIYEVLGFKVDKKGVVELTHYSRNNQNPLDKFQEDFPLYTSRGENSEYKDYGKQFNFIVKKDANIKSLLDFHGKYGIDLDKHDEASKGLQPYHFSLQEVQAIRKEGVDILIDDWGEYIILNPNSVVLKEQQKQQAQQVYSQYLNTIFPDYIDNFTYEAVEELLVVNKIIDRKC